MRHLKISFPNSHSFRKKRGILYRRTWCYPQHYNRQYLRKGTVRVKCPGKEHNTLGTSGTLSTDHGYARENGDASKKWI